jgi:hypothetical protein
VEDLQPPDSRIAKRALELCARVSPRFLVNHSSRTFAWGCILAHQHHIALDRELFYVGSILHDLGLTAEFEGPRCFEHESAAAAVRFSLREGWPPDRSAILGEAIRLHMQARVVIEDGVEAYLLSEATTCDVRGKWLHEIDEATRTRVLSRFPRSDFKVKFIEMCEDQARRKPGCMVDVFLQQGLASEILEAPFDS